MGHRAGSWKVAVGTACGAWLALASPFVVADTQTPPIDVSTAGGSGRPPPVEEKMVTGFGLKLEEDKFLDFPVARSLGTNMDRNYTGGGAISSSGRWVHAAYLDAPLRILDLLLFIPKYAHDHGFRDTHTFSFGVTAFTPLDVASTQVVSDDRPYGSLAFLAVSHLSVNHADTVAVTSDFTFGMLGLHMGDWVQTTIHEHLGYQTPQGWSHQISEGGEPTARYGLGIQWRPEWADRLRWADLTGSLKGEAGYFTGAAAGLTARLGCINSDPWQFAENSMRTTNEAGPKCQWKVGGHLAEAFVWGTARGRVVGYNALLQGQTQPSDYTLPSDRINRLLGEYELGVTLSLYRVRASWLPVIGRTAEFSGPLARTHTWGSLFLGFDGTFGT